MMINQKYRSLSLHRSKFSSCLTWLFLLFMALLGMEGCEQRSPEGKLSAPTVKSSGERLFQSKCMDCHSLKPNGWSEMGGPSLYGIFHRRNETWIREYILRPEEMAKGDPQAQALREKYSSKMPNFSLTQEQLDHLVAFLKETTQ